MIYVILNDDIIRMIFCLLSHASTIFHCHISDTSRLLFKIKEFVLEVKEFVLKNEDPKRDQNKILGIPSLAAQVFFMRTKSSGKEVYIGFPVSISIPDRRDCISHVDK